MKHTKLELGFRSLEIKIKKMMIVEQMNNSEQEPQSCQTDENGLISSEDNEPCLFCNIEAFIDYHTYIEDKEL